MAIFYEDPDLIWFGDDNMGAHFYRNFTKASTTAHITFGEPMVGDNGEELLKKVRDWKLLRLGEFRKTHGSGV